ncbi:murein biosynthesis protein MurJ, partial [Streptomyces griseorubens]
MTSLPSQATGTAPGPRTESVPSRAKARTADAPRPQGDLPSPGAQGQGEPTPSRRFLARAALVTAALSIAGSLLGLVRDQSRARLFGAGRDTDAFLVAWTVPERAPTLRIEDGLARARF